MPNGMLVIDTVRKAVASPGNGAAAPIDPFAGVARGGMAGAA